MRLMLLFLLTLCNLGCAVRNLHRDHDQIRQTLLDLYTDQIMDNLVRASNGLPIIQLDYTNAAGTVTNKQSATFSPSQAVTNQSVFAQAATRTRTILTTLGGSMGADHTNQVSVTATPVINSNEVYDAYLQFLSLPGSIQSSCEHPPACGAHICRQYGDKYYWVPIAYRADFLKLSLVTTAQRGKALFAADSFYSVNIQEVLGVEDGQFDDVYKLTVRIDKKIPTDSGYARVNMSQTEVQFVIQPPDDGKSETDKVILTLDTTVEGAPKSIASFKGKLPLPAKIYLRYNQPKPPTTDDLIERVNFQLQQIQFNQLR